MRSFFALALSDLFCALSTHPNCSTPTRRTSPSVSAPPRPAPPRPAPPRPAPFKPPPSMGFVPLKWFIRNLFSAVVLMLIGVILVSDCYVATVSLLNQDRHMFEKPPSTYLVIRDQIEAAVEASNTTHIQSCPHYVPVE